MAESEILLTVAELAVAFAGFASLVGILGKPTTVDAARMNAARLQAMLESALVALAFALIPLLPHLFGSSETVAWRLAAAGFGTTNLVRLWRFATRIPEIRAAGGSMGWSLVVVLAQIISVLVLLVVAVGVAGESAAAAYVLALFIALFVSGVFFQRLAVALFASQQRET